MTRIHLVTALVRRAERVLLVATRYPNHAQPLWNMPGGRQQPGELLSQAALRELREETGLRGTMLELCYVSESYDAQTHFTNFTFAVHVDADAVARCTPGDRAIETEWTSVDRIAERIAVAVVREPLLAFLNGTLPRYAGYAEAGISIEFPD